MDLIRKTRRAWKNRGTISTTPRSEKNSRNVRFDDVIICKTDQDVRLEKLTNSAVWEVSDQLHMSAESDDHLLDLRMLPSHQPCHLEFPRRSFTQVFEEVVQKNPHTTVVRSGEQQVTFHELNADVNKLARSFYSYLHNTGALGRYRLISTSSAAPAVAVMMSNPVTQLTALFAMWKLGVCVTVVDMSYNRGQVQQLLMETKCSTVIWDTDEVFKKILDLQLAGKIYCG